MSAEAIRRAMTDDQICHLIELRDVHDGFSIAVLHDGTQLNRWASCSDPARPSPGYERRYYATQDVIDSYTVEES